MIFKSRSESIFLYKNKIEKKKSYMINLIVIINWRSTEIVKI